MTEEEAKTRWCPHVRMIHGEIKANGDTTHNANQGPYNRIVDDSRSAFAKGGACIASGCMAWRWMSEHHLEPSGVEDGMAIAADGRVTMDGQRLGFCGLAGAPQ